MASLLSVKLDRARQQRGDEVKSAPVSFDRNGRARNEFWEIH
jgi:hypothetical protein